MHDTRNMSSGSKNRQHTLTRKPTASTGDHTLTPKDQLKEFAKSKKQEGGRSQGVRPSCHKELRNPILHSLKKTPEKQMEKQAKLTLEQVNTKDAGPYRRG